MSVKSTIDVTQPKKKAPAPDFINNLSKMQGEYATNFFGPLGINGLQFEALFNSIPQGMALFSIVYGKTGVPVDFFAIEVIFHIIVFYLCLYSIFTPVSRR